MKMIYNGTPVNSMKVKHYEVSTNDCDMIASDLQAGKTAVARGKKIVGTGKSFEFAFYGTWMTNTPLVIPAMINAIQISSIIHPIKAIVSVHDTTLVDFSQPQTIAEVNINGVIYPLVATVQNGMLTIACDHAIDIELFYGKDRYV